MSNCPNKRVNKDWQLRCASLPACYPCRSKYKMMKTATKKRMDSLLTEVSKIISDASDADIPMLLGDGIIDQLLKAIAKPKTDNQQNIYDYLLSNKNRLQLLALIRLAIHNNFSIKGKIQDMNEDIYVSPYHIQWFDDGIMFLQGKKQFEGLIGLYQNGQVKFAIAKRDMRPGEKLTEEAFDFINIDEMKERVKQSSVPKNVNDLDKSLVQLENLLQLKENNESIYQDYLIEHPWVIGAQYSRIDSHLAFDDQNIPDFTGIRVRDSARDIFEIKSPFLSLFKSNDTFRAEFNDAWNQTERYLDFARRESDYLRREKGLFFDNPKCYLIAGYNLNDNQLREIRRKERMNPAITILTYNDLLAMTKYTIEFIKNLNK